jgi:exosortase/archaeosortase family protein
MHLPAVLRRGGPALRFCLLFLLFLSLLALLFENSQTFFAFAYMYPVSALAAFLLNLLGIAADLDTSTLLSGFCDLVLGGVAYRIIHECTGLFALLTFLALVFAYPAAQFQKVQGVLLGLPAFYAYSALRLVVLGMVAQWQPAWVETFHLYMMVLVNLGFTLFVWMSWIDRVVYGD